MLHQLDVANSILASSAALWRGTSASAAAAKPAQPLEIYEMENCPYCRLVREALTELDLDAVIYPCPKGGERYRPKVIELGGKAQFPFMVDPNTGEQMYESADIVEYLYRTYANVEAPAHWKIKSLDTFSSMVASGLRLTKGMRARASASAEKPLELWGFESSPYARLVRERLCELEIPYLTHNIGKAQWQDFVLTKYRDQLWPELEHKGDKRRQLKQKAGKVMSPFLEDPNTGVAMFESADIIAYLDKQYGQEEA